MAEFVQAFRMEEVVALETGGNASCYKCGFGETCPYSAFIAMNGKDAKMPKDPYYRFENDSDCVVQAVELEQAIAKRIEEKN